MSTDVVTAAEAATDELYQALEQKVRAARRDADLTELRRAFQLAAEAHKNHLNDDRGGLDVGSYTAPGAQQRQESSDN